MTTKDEAIKNLKKLLKPYNKVYTILRHVSSTGMSRRISLVVVKKNEPLLLDYWVEEALEIKHGAWDGIKVGGTGMDMGFHLVYQLSSVLFPKGFRESNPYSPTGQEWRDDGGYALGHSWL